MRTHFVTWSQRVVIDIVLIAQFILIVGAALAIVLAVARLCGVGDYHHEFPTPAYRRRRREAYLVLAAGVLVLIALLG